MISLAGSIQGTVTAPALGDDGGDRPVRGALIRAEPLTEVSAAGDSSLALAADDFRATAPIRSSSGPRLWRYRDGGRGTRTPPVGYRRPCRRDDDVHFETTR